MSGDRGGEWDRRPFQRVVVCIHSRPKWRMNIKELQICWITGSVACTCTYLQVKRTYIITLRYIQIYLHKQIDKSSVCSNFYFHMFGVLENLQGCRQNTVHSNCTCRGKVTYLSTREKYMPCTKVMTVGSYATLQLLRYTSAYLRHTPTELCHTAAFLRHTPAELCHTPPLQRYTPA